MSVSTRRIQPVHGAFGSPSHYGFSGSSMEASWNRIPNVCAPRVRLYEGPSPPIAPTSRTSFATGVSSSGSTGAGTRVGVPLSVSPSGNRSRRTSVTYDSPTPTRRAPPPPPVPAERTASALKHSVVPPPVVSLPPVIPKLEDPFADAENDGAFTPLTPPPPVRSSSITSRTRVTVSTYTVPSSSGSSASFTTPPGLGRSRGGSTKDSNSRLVASVLLSRTSGRPLGAYLRRRLSGEQQGYVKSGLSQLVAAAA